VDPLIKSFFTQDNGGDNKKTERNDDFHQIFGLAGFSFGNLFLHIK